MGDKNHIPKAKAKSSGLIPNPQEKVGSTNHQLVRLSFELFNYDAQCPSTWQGQMVRQLFSAFTKATQKTWQQVIETGGKAYGGKVGLGFTTFKESPITRPLTLSNDIPISEMRVNDTARFFGARKDATYYVIELDKGHDVCG